MNNLKIYISKKICDKIKLIDTRTDDSGQNYILSYTLKKKSDSNVTWEE